MLQKVEDRSTVCNKTCRCCACYYHRLTCLAARWRREQSPGRITQWEVWIHSTATTLYFAARQVCTRVEKRAASIVELFCRNVARRTGGFCWSYYCALTLIWAIIFYLVYLYFKAAWIVKIIHLMHSIWNESYLK